MQLYIEHLKKLISFIIPITFGQLGLMLIPVGDVFIVSQYSTEAVAAVGISTGFLNPLLLFGAGLMIGVSPKLSQFLGEKKSVDQYVPSLIAYGTVVGLVLTLLMLAITPLIEYFEYEAKTYKLMSDYISIYAWSFSFALLYEVLKEFLQAKEKIIYANIVAIVCVLLNLGLNYILVFGKFGFPELGVKGAAITSCIVRAVMFVCLLIPLLKYLKKIEIELGFLKEVFKFSLPIGVMFFFEVLAFCIISIVSGKFGTVSAASNHIVLNLASVAFMVPLSISRAASVKVGYFYGERNFSLMKVYWRSSLLLTVLFMLFSFSCFYFLAEELMRLFTKDTLVIALGIKLLFVVAIFQFVDGIQVTLAGVLRGLNKTTFVSIAVFVAYWFIGIPSGLLLAYQTDYKTIGIWIGLAVSLGVISLILSLYLQKTIREVRKFICTSN